MIPILTFTFELWPPKSIGFTMVNMCAKFNEEAQNGLVCVSFTAYFHTCPLWPWPLTSKMNRVHPLTMINISAKFDAEIHNGLISFVFTSLSRYMSIASLNFDLWPPKSIGFILSSWLTSLPSLIKQNTQWLSFYHVHKLISIYVHCDLDLWPPKSIGFILSLWLTFVPSLIKKHTAV